MVFDVSDGPIKYEKTQAHIATSSQDRVFFITAKDIATIVDVSDVDNIWWKDPGDDTELPPYVDPENDTEPPSPVDLEKDTDPVHYVLDSDLQLSLKTLDLRPGQKSTVKYKGWEYGIALDTEGKLTLSDVARKKQYTMGHILIKKIDKSGSGVLKLMKSFGKKIHIDTMKFYAISWGACGLCIDIGDLKQWPEQSVWNNLFVWQYVVERILEAIRLGEDSVLINLNNTQTKKAIEAFKKIPPEIGYPPWTPFRDIKIEVMKMFQGEIHNILVIEFCFKSAA